MSTMINLTPTGSSFEISLDKKVFYGHDERPRLTGRTWGTPSECRQAALLVHGLGAHSGWFEALGRRLKVRQIFSLAYDQVGFGKRRHEHFFSREQWITDLEAAYNHLCSLVGNIPVYLMGNSMGAVVALEAVSRIKPAGLIMFSPGFDGHPQTFRLWYRIKGLLTAFFNPDAEVDLPYSISEVTSNTTIRQWLLDDPERRFRLPAHMLLEVLRLSHSVEKHSTEVTCPVLMFTAGIDRIVDNRTVRRVYDKLSCPKKTERHFSEAWHDLMFDNVLDKLVEELAKWIEETSPKRLMSQA